MFSRKLGKGRQSMKATRYLFMGFAGLITLAAVTTTFAAPLTSANTAIAARPSDNPHGKPFGTPEVSMHGTEQSLRATERATEQAARATERADRKKPEHFRGVVASAGSGALVLNTSSGPITFAVTSGTRIRIPTVSGPSLADIHPGVQAFVLATHDNSGGYVAIGIDVIPGKPEHVHRVGIVTAYTPGVSITVQDIQGGSSTFLLAPNLKILPADRAGDLKVGSLVTVISRRDPSGGPLTAEGIVVHPESGTPTAMVSPTPTETPTPTPTNSPTPTATTGA
jgi:hypothetical protein